MSKSSKGEGIKIAQAAKDLGVTSVTIRRYISEFDIETTSDENGIKVLPEAAMDELHEIRRLKEDGMTNPKVLEHLEEMRAKGPKEKKAETKKPAAKRVVEAVKVEAVKKETKKPEPRRASRKVDESVAARVLADDDDDQDDDDDAGEAADDDESAMPAVAVAETGKTAEGGEEGGELGADGRSKHSLTCQTCGKVFEHMNPRLRDCLECYRAKRKERRRDKHKNVIQHPLAAQVTSKQQQRQSADSDAGDDADAEFDVTPIAAPSVVAAAPLPMSSKRINPLAGTHKTSVRNYRKAIEETRQITANLKRRLERPDLPENERRWLEQIYAYQLILHQGWRHLAEYKAGTPAGGQRQTQET
jgi:DNA-binding transcriptional MerR regulator